MSDFLGRLTARHAEGSSSAIVPRAVSRFEAPALPVERDMAEQRTPVERAASPAPMTLPIIDPSPRIPSHVDDASRERAPQNDRREPAPVRPVDSTSVRIEQMLKQVETITRSTSVASEPTQEPSKQPIVTATPVIPRLGPPVEPRPATPMRGLPVQTPAVDREPNVIRVHIGRIDVRANVPAVDRPRPRSTSSEKTKPMSLDGYLRGKDRA